MQKKFFDHLYRQVQRIDICSCDVTQLIALSHLCNNVNSLESVILCLNMEYGGRQKLIKRAKAIAKILVSKTEEGMRMDVLFEYSNRYMDREWEDRLLERAWVLLTKHIPAPKQETGFCQLLCDCYYMVREVELADRAKIMIANWCQRQTGTGEWPGIDSATAMKRLYVIDNYHICTLRSDFEAFHQKGINYYLRDFPEHSTKLSGEQLPLFLQQAELLLFVGNPRTERKRIEQTGTILEQYLQETDLAAPDNASYPDTPDKKSLVSGKRFPEPVLHSLSVLSACLLAQKGWECEEHAEAIIL